MSTKPRLGILFQNLVFCAIETQRNLLPWEFFNTFIVGRVL